VGILCERTSPHLSITLTVFNSSRTDWWVADSAGVGKGQTENEHTLTSTIASVLGIKPSRVELAYSKAQEQLGTGAQSAIGGRRGERRVVEHCLDAEGGIRGIGLAKVEVRLLYTFEHELPTARSKIKFALTNGTLEEALAAKDLYLCFIDSNILNYNSFGFKMESRDVSQVPNGISLTDVLLIVFSLMGVAVVLLYLGLQVMVQRSLELDATRHLREYMPIRKIEKQVVGWRLVHPDTKEPMHLPSSLNKELEAFYITQWLQEGDPLYTFDLPLAGKWTADFSAMRAYENTAGQTLMVVKVKDGMTMTLDRSSSQNDHFYNARSVTITAIPENSDPRLLNQERQVSAYSALLREIRTESPFVPPPPPGIQITIGGKMGLAYRDLLAPGMDYQLSVDFVLEEQPAKGAKSKYQAWMQQSRDVTKYRLKHESHFPNSSQAPPTTDVNIFRLKEIQDKRAQIAADARLKNVSRTKLGRMDNQGNHHFTGEDLSQWQAAHYTHWREVETEKEEFEVQLQKDQWGEQTENMELDDQRYPEALFREEIFKPGSSLGYIEKFGATAPKDPNGQKRSRRPSVASAGSSPFARRRRSSATTLKPEKEEIFDEVAV